MKVAIDLHHEAAAASFRCSSDWETLELIIEVAIRATRFVF